MKQVLQNLKTGGIEVVEVPDPQIEPGRVIVRVVASVISAGTESHQVAGAAKGIVERVLEKPQLIRKGLQTLGERGVSGLRQQIATKYEGYSALGYSCAGRVVALGPDVTGVAVGQLVACGGIGFANHAELVSVPVNLCAPAPENVAAEHAAFATLGAIAMQGVRQADAKLGETVAVIGLGLVGLLTVQLLRAAGCTVVGIDPNENARRRGLACGCIAAIDSTGATTAVASASHGIGADAVIICAAAADSSPLVLAGELARSRGRVVMVGLTGMEIPREAYFRKELTFALSRSYGPGRYDRSYEEDGHDYPVDFVRFTEQRNMGCFLDLLAAGKLDLAPLITHRLALGDAPQAYALLKDPAADRCGIVLNFPATEISNAWKPTPAKVPTAGNFAGFGLIGAGAYAKAVLLPLFAKHGAGWRGVATRGGVTSTSVAKQFAFAFAATSPEEVIADASCGTIIIATRHDSHAKLAAAALRAGKNVWVEKPLALTTAELREVREAYRPGLKLVVGFNRPFSPLAEWMKKNLPAGGPVMMNYRVNAGLLPADHWTNDPKSGGGRLLGEGCHFLDFMRHFAGTPRRVTTSALGGGRADLPATGSFVVSVEFVNGSVGQLLYSAQGSPALPKERFEIFSGNACGVLDDFKRAQVFIGGETREHVLKQQDKGQAAMIEAFVKNGPANVEEVFTSSLLTLAAQASLERQAPVDFAEFAASV